MIHGWEKVSKPLKKVFTLLSAMAVATSACYGVLAEDTNSTKLVPLKDVMNRLATPSLPASWVPLIRLGEDIYFVVMILYILYHAAHSLMHNEDKSQVVADIVKLGLMVIVVWIVIFKVLPAVL